jgi:hypothetical protein
MFRRSFMSGFRASTANRAANRSSAVGAPILEPTTQHFIDALIVACGPPLYALTPQAAHEVLSDAQAGDAQAGADRHFTARELLLKVSGAR